MTTDQNQLTPTAFVPLFTNVKLIRHLSVEGESLQVGASGMIVETLGNGESYIVEFFEPHHCVVTVHDDALSKERA